MRAFIVLMPVVVAVGFSAWTAIGPNGGPIYSGGIATADPPTIYLAPYASPANLVKSTDGGESWFFTSGQIPTYPQNILVHPSDPEMVYALTGAALYKTTNGGASWSVYSLPSSNYFRALRFNPLNPEVLYAVGYNYTGSVYRTVLARSINAGVNWQVFFCDTAAPSYGYSLAVDPIDTNVIYVGGYRGSGATTLHRSSDCGETWEELNLGVNGYYPYAVEVNPANNNIIIIAPYSSGIYRSTDKGESWTRVANYYGIYQIAPAGGDAAILYATTSSRLYRSTDSGATWVEIGTGIYGGLLYALLPHPMASGTVYCGTKAGIFRSTDFGNTWQEISGNFSFNKIKVLALAGDDNTIYTECQDNAVYRSFDNGNTWERCPEFLSCGNICAMAVHPFDPATVWALEGSG